MLRGDHRLVRARRSLAHSDRALRGGNDAASPFAAGTDDPAFAESGCLIVAAMCQRAVFQPAAYMRPPGRIVRAFVPDGSPGLHRYYALG